MRGSYGSSGGLVVRVTSSRTACMTEADVRSTYVKSVVYQCPFFAVVGRLGRAANSGCYPLHGMSNFQSFPRQLPSAQQGKENLDLNVRKQFATQAAAVLKEPTSKPVETARVPDSQTVLYPSENERIRVEEIIEDDSSYNGQESIPAKETVIPTSWNENSGKNTSAVSSKIQEKNMLPKAQLNTLCVDRGRETTTSCGSIHDDFSEASRRSLDQR
ncbi:hypothetical protein TNCV_1551281 [Trichonephila clavipes]|nr:hypothetical protein TNCV_1551281 [Trichonephila clavipes]